MTEPSLNELYKKLRTATLKHDDAAAIALLQQIVQINPSDKQAGKQLQSLQKSTPASIAAPTVKRPTASAKATSKLYNHLRSARLAKDDLKAFEIIEQILQNEPGDADALAQRKEIGARLAVQQAPELEAALKTGDGAQISQAVIRFQQLADDDILQTLPNYAAALALHKNHVRKNNEKQLQNHFNELNQIESAFEQEQKAQQIETFAQQANLKLSNEQSKTISQCHENWKQTCLTSEQYEQFDQIIEQYNRLREKISLGTNLHQLRDELQEIRNKLNQLTEVEEAAEIIAKTNTDAKRIIEKIKKENRSKSVKTFFILMLILTVLSSSGISVYAYMNVEKRAAEFAEAYEKKNITAAQTLLANAEPMCWLYSRINSEYAEWKIRLTKWINKFKAGQAKLTQYERWLDENLGKCTLETAKTFHDDFIKYREVLEEMQEDFKYTVSSSLQRKHDSALEELTQRLKKEAMSKFSAPPADADIEKLAGLYKEYRAFRDNFTLISDDEHKNIKQAYHDKAHKVLIRSQKDEALFRKTYQIAKKHATELELTDEFFNDAETILDNEDKLKKLPDKLANSQSLEFYAKTLSEHAEILKAKGQEVPLPYLEKIQANLPTLSMRLKLEKISPTSATYTDAKLQQTIEHLKKAYSSNTPLLINYSPSEYNRIINLMTLPEEAPEWSDEFCYVTKARWVYVGKISRVNNTVYIRELSPSMKVSPSTRYIGTDADIQTLTLKNFRQATGFNRLELQKGNILPTVLMQNLAKADYKGYAPLAKAYLFSLCIDFLSLVDDMSSGVAFSKTLQKDINDFKELTKWLAKNGAALNPKCWCLKHRTSHDERINSFFHRIADHNYSREILAKLHETSDDLPRFVGYFTPAGNYVVAGNYSTSELYYVDGDKLVPLSNEQGRAYNPIFYIKTN